MAILVFDVKPGQALECVAQDRHQRKHHRPHPATGRIVCNFCHPPAAHLKEMNRAAS